jgi:hypothetical protein
MLSTCGSAGRRASTTFPPPTYITPFAPLCGGVVMDENLTMLIGPASDGTLLEIGVLDIDGDDPVVIHATQLRPKFYRFLG